MKILPRGDVRAECLNTKCVCGEADKCKKFHFKIDLKVKMKM
jgi:hypothetical protein